MHLDLVHLVAVVGYVGLFVIVFAETGLLGAGPQTTAWLYMYWHAGFPLAVLAYGLLKGRGDDRFAGLYLKLRWPNVEIGAGGGARNDDFIQHGALYVKGARWSAALGGAHGANGVDYEHFAATWHPTRRGGAPGMRLIAERRSADRYQAELMFTDRATFNHFAV